MGEVGALGNALVDVVGGEGEVTDTPRNGLADECEGDKSWVAAMVHAHRDQAHIPYALMQGQQVEGWC